MDSSILILDSDDESDDRTPVLKGLQRKPEIEIIKISPKRPLNVSSSSNRRIAPPRKRIKPIQISDVVSLGNNAPLFPDEFVETVFDDNKEELEQLKPDDNHDEESINEDKSEEKTPMNSDFLKLIETLRKADNSPDMDRLITKKLVRYYESVHPDFVNSKSFLKSVQSTRKEIETNPGLVYLKISSILEELNTRRKIRSTVVVNEEVTSTGNEKKDNQIKRLNKALYILKRKINKLESEDVDFNEDQNSVYLMGERYKKRACEIYEKICDITGESKHAHRTVKKPITFQGTIYTQFNKSIQAFVNRTNSFPDFFDVLKCLEYCNKQYEFKLKADEMKKIAQDAFIKVGKSLQTRRKTDLYETTIQYFVSSTDPDPAIDDIELQSKLSENKKYDNRISEIIDKYAERQETGNKEKESVNNNSETENNENESINNEKSNEENENPQPNCSKACIEENFDDSLILLNDSEDLLTPLS